MSKIHEILHKDICKHREQLSILTQLQIPKGLQVINSGTKSKLKIPRILKGFKTFWKKLDKFYPPKLELRIILH
jgi:hypothetical protein